MPQVCRGLHYLSNINVRILHAVHLPETGFNLAQLYPESSELDLMINSSEIFEQTLSVEFCFVAGPVEFSAGVQNIVLCKLLIGEPWIVQIAKRYAFTSKQ